MKQNYQNLTERLTCTKIWHVAVAAREAKYLKKNYYN